MKEQEIVQAWKQNDRYFASPSITDEMREWAKKDYSKMQTLSGKELRWINKICPEFESQVIYRLRPDFELPKEPCCSAILEGCNFNHHKGLTVVNSGKDWVCFDSSAGNIYPELAIEIASEIIRQAVNVMKIRKDAK